MADYEEDEDAGGNRLAALMGACTVQPAPPRTLTTRSPTPP